MEDYSVVNSGHSHHHHNDTTHNLDPEQCISSGLWEVEPLYYCTSYNSNGNKRLKRGKAYRSLETSEYVCFESHDGCLYRVGDNVYLDSQQPELAYFICGILAFKMTKRDQLNIKVSWYYRHSEVPQGVYHTLVQDRHTEHSQQDSQTELCIQDPKVRNRELFISDAQDTYPISTLRGKCVIRHYKDIAAAREFQPKPDTFFYILGYNPENNRLASIQGEIRVGPSYQVKLPELRTNAPYTDETTPIERETLMWSPACLADSDLKMYLRAVRSMAAFAGICNGATDDGMLAAAKDSTTTTALETLHQNGYDTGEAMKQLVYKPTQITPQAKWSEEETKKFVKGLKQYGKHFWRIRRELLQHKTTADLVEFYYLWKKTAAAANQRPRRGPPRPKAPLRRIKPPNGNKPSRPSSSEFLDRGSASENEEENEETDNRDLIGYTCHHCYSTASKDWHHAGKDRALLCTDCRSYFKKYGDLRSVNRPSTPPPSLFKSISKETGQAFLDDYGVRTRAGKAAGKDVFAVGRKRTVTPTADMESARKSPSAASTSSTSSVQSSSSNKSGRKGKGNRRRKLSKKSIEDEATKKKRQKQTSTDRSDESDSSVESTATSPKPPFIEEPILAANAIKSPVPIAETAESVFEFKEEAEDIPEPLKEVQNENIENSPPKLIEDLPKAPTSVIQVNLNSVKQEVDDEQDENNDNIATKEPDARIDDSVLYESKSCIFRRHWNRGETNSCSRTDLIPLPKPDSKWQKWLDKLQKHHEPEKIKVKQEIPNETGTSVRPPTAASGSGLCLTSPHHQSQTPFGVPPGFATPMPPESAMQRLSFRQFAEHSQANGPMQNGALIPQIIQQAIMDPMLQQRILAGQFGDIVKQQLEALIMDQARQEQLKRDYEIASKTMAPGQMIDPRQLFELQQRMIGGAGLPANLPNDPALLEHYLNTQRVHLERLATAGDPMARMQLEHLIALCQHHTHSHTHSHTHLHIHPSVSGASGMPPPGTPLSTPGPPEPLLQPYGPRPLGHPHHYSPFHPGLDPNAFNNSIDTARFAMMSGAPPIGMLSAPDQQVMIAAERMRQEQLQRQQQQLFIDRQTQVQAAQVIQYNEMLRRLQDEGNSASGPSVSSGGMRPM